MALSKEEKIRVEIFTWLALFSKSELTQLRKFLDSPFFNNTPEVGKIYERLYEQLKRGVTDGWNAQKQADNLYKEKLPGARLHKLYEHLLKLKELIRQFIAHLELKNTPATEQQVVVAALSQRPGKTLFEEACDTYENLLDTKVLDADTYANLAWLHRERHSYQTAERFAPNPAYFIAANTYLDRHYLALKLRHIIEALIAQYIFKEKSKVTSVTQELLMLAQEHASYDPLINAYINIIHFIRHGLNNESLGIFHQEFIKNHSLFSPKEQQVIVAGIINLCFRWMLNENSDLSIASIVEWFKMALHLNVLNLKHLAPVDKNISDDLFLSIAISAAITHDFEFCEAFIKHYQEYLEPLKREKVISVAMAYRYLHDDQHHAAYHCILKLYHKLILDEPKYSLRARMVKIRFHLMNYLATWEDHEEFQKTKDAFRKYLDGERTLHEDRKNAYRNFLTATGLIYYHKNNHKKSSEDKEILKNSINQYAPIIGKEWLIKIVDKI